MLAMAIQWPPKVVSGSEPGGFPTNKQWIRTTYSTFSGLSLFIWIIKDIIISIVGIKQINEYKSLNTVILISYGLDVVVVVFHSQ